MHSLLKPTELEAGLDTHSFFVGTMPWYSFLKKKRMLTGQIMMKYGNGNLYFKSPLKMAKFFKFVIVDLILLSQSFSTFE